MYAHCSRTKVCHESDENGRIYCFANDENRIVEQDRRHSSFWVISSENRVDSKIEIY